MARRVETPSYFDARSKKKSRCAAPSSSLSRRFWRPLYSSRMLDGPFTELGPCACARGRNQKTTAIKITCLIHSRNACCRPRPLSWTHLNTSCRLSELSSDHCDEIAALQTRPSVCPPIRWLRILLLLSILLDYFSQSWVLLNQSLIEFLLAGTSPRNPYPRPSERLARRSAFLQPAGAPQELESERIHGLFMSSPCGVSIFLSVTSGAFQHLLKSRFIRLFL